MFYFYFSKVLAARGGGIEQNDYAPPPPLKYDCTHPRLQRELLINFNNYFIYKFQWCFLFWKGIELLSQAHLDISKYDSNKDSWKY